MALDFLTGTYTVHKTQTASVLSWLTGTGRKCNVRPPKRWNIDSSSAKAARSTYLIDVNDIVPFAKLVVEASTKLPPVDVLRDLDQTIASRRRFTDWYRSQNVADVALEQRNKSHEHFNNVLEELLVVLTPSSSNREAIVSHDRDGDPESASEFAPISKNPFDILELESLAFADTDDDLLSVSQTVPLPRPVSGKVQTKTPYELQASNDDTEFAVFKMLADLHRVRRHIHELLERYRTYNLSLLLVSAVVNCAIGIVRRIERDFLSTVPQFTNWEEVMDKIVSLTQYEKVHASSSGISETIHFRSVYCLPFQELKCFRASIFEGERVGCHHDRVPILRVEGSQIDKQDTWKVDRIILLEFFKEIASLGVTHPFPVEDELTCGIREVFRKKRKNPIPLWIVFGLRVFLDTQHILGEEVTRPFREFKASSEAFTKNIDDDIQMSEVMRKEKLDHAEKIATREMSDRINGWVTDDVLMGLRENYPKLGPGRPFFFMSHNPVVCGLMQCVTLLSSQSKGISIMNASMFATCAAHLYNATMNENHLQSRWPDMDKLIDLYGRSNIFLGAPPKTASAYEKHYLIAQGFSIRNFAKGKNEKREYSNKGARLLEVPKIMETLGKVLRQTSTTDTDMHVDLVENFLHQTVDQQATQKKGSVRALNPVQLLMVLEHCMEKEEAKLVLNYYTLNRSCWMMLSAIYSEVEERFKASLPAQSRGQDPNSLLCHLPPFIFRTFAEESDKRGASKETIMSRVGRVMEKYISSEVQNSSPTVVGVVNDNGIETETEHGTQNGECIHWGECDRMKKYIQS